LGHELIGAAESTTAFNKRSGLKPVAGPVGTIPGQRSRSARNVFGSRHIFSRTTRESGTNLLPEAPSKIESSAR
jgi:hypothetical protein